MNTQESRWRPITFVGGYDLAPFEIDQSGGVRNRRKRKLLRRLSRREASEYWIRHCVRGFAELVDTGRGVEPRRFVESPDEFIESFMEVLTFDAEGRTVNRQYQPATSRRVRWLYGRKGPPLKAFDTEDLKAGRKPEVLVSSDFPPDDVPLVGDHDRDWYGLSTKGTDNNGHTFYSVLHGPSVARLIFEKHVNTD